MPSPFRNVWVDRKRFRLAFATRLAELIHKSLSGPLSPQEEDEKNRIKAILKALS